MYVVSAVRKKMRSRPFRNRTNVTARSSDRFASSSTGRRAPAWGYIRLNWTRVALLPRARYNPDIMLARVPGARFNSKTTPSAAEKASGGAAPALNPGMRVCACFTSAPRLFADSKLCRTMPAEPLSLADYKTGKNGKSPRMPFCRPVMEIVDTLTGPYPANWNAPLPLPRKEKF